MTNPNRPPTPQRPAAEAIREMVMRTAVLRVETEQPVQTVPPAIVKRRWLK